MFTKTIWKRWKSASKKQYVLHFSAVLYEANLILATPKKGTNSSIDQLPYHNPPSPLKTHGFFFLGGGGPGGGLGQGKKENKKKLWWTRFFLNKKILLKRIIDLFFLGKSQ